MADNPHSGHRARMRRRCLEEGLDGFADHEVLELLLYYTIPYRDTNPLAHRLIDHFGSLSGVLDADARELVRVDGISENTAFFLATLPEVFRRYQLDQFASQPILSGRREAGEYVLSLFIGATCEQFYLVCLDSKQQILKTVLLSEGTVRQAAVFPRMVVESALRYRAVSVILAHNHLSRITRPSSEDMSLTARVTTALNAIDIGVYDHIIACGNQYVSLADMGLLR